MSAEQRYFEDVQEGDELPTLVKRCSRRQLVLWAAASGDFYEIHYHDAYAAEAGLPGVVVHGALKHAFLGQLLDEWVGQRGRVVRSGCSYRGLDFPERELRCRGVVRGKRREGADGLVELEIWLENDRGERTTPGSAVVALPTRD